MGRRWELEKRISSLTDYSLCPIRGKRESFGIRGAARGRQHFVQHLRSERVADFPATGRLNPNAAQRAKRILVVIPGESQILGELLRERTLALRGICSAGGQWSPWRASYGLGRVIDFDSVTVRVRHFDRLINNVDDTVGIGPLVKIGVDGGGAPQPETTYQYRGAHSVVIIASDNDKPRWDRRSGVGN